MFIHPKGRAKKLRHAFIAKSIALALACSANVFAAPESIDIQAQSLAKALKALGQQTGLQIIYNADLIKGKQSPAVKGSYEPTEVLRILLDDSNVTFNLSENTVTLIYKNEPTSEEIYTLALTQVGNSRVKGGSAEAGYRVGKTTSIGPLQGKAIIDTPYSIAVLPSSLLENTIASSVDQVFRMSPTIQVAMPSNDNDRPEITMRGFSSTEGLLDGIKSSNVGLSLEDIEQVEILTGTSGFMFGPGNVGGRVNYVYKRPTQERLTNISVGNYGGEQYFVHADLGGKIDDEGIFGYRVNVVKQDGETAIEDEHVDRFSIAGAFDWHISESLLAQVVFSHRDYKVGGKPARWYNTSSDAAFDAPDTSRAYGPKWAGIENTTNRLKFDLSWQINDVFTLRSAYFRKQADNPVYNWVDNWSLSENNASWFDAEVGDFAQYNMIMESYQWDTTGTNLFIDARFNSGSIEHNMTLGYASGKEEYSFGEKRSFDTVHSNIENLNTTVEPDWSTLDVTLDGYFLDENYTNFFIADEIIFNEQWSTQLGLNYVSIKSNSTSGGFWGGSSYEDSAFTPTVSILYKPLGNLTSYFTYMEALEKGTIVNGDYINSGEVLEPLISEEIELGLKYELSDTDLLLTAALFRIEKSNNYDRIDAAGQLTLTQDGLAVHQGLELGFTGKATENLTLLGGLTLLDASIKDSDDPELEGERIAEVANTMAKVYAEYAVPAVNDLVLTAGLYYTGSATWYQKDDYKTKAYTLADIGLRYSNTIADTPITFRVAVTNLTDKDYWINREFLGTPRTVSFSMSATF
jgi:iron complex outermembrane receptor protein